MIRQSKSEAIFPEKNLEKWTRYAWDEILPSDVGINHSQTIHGTGIFTYMNTKFYH